MSKVYIILINYKNWQDTIECLESLKKINYKKIEIILSEVCDLNNSRKEIKKYLENYPLKTKIIYLKQNNGFAFANNQALKKILAYKNSEFIWILNNDTIVEKNALKSLAELYFEKKKISKPGFIGSKIVEYDNPMIIQTVGGTFNPKTGYSKLIGKGKKDKNQFNNKQLKPDYVIGASMFFHKNLILDIGLMPEDYFLYYEDIDWCFKALKKGYTNYTCLKSKILHKQGRTTGNKYNKKKTKSTTRKYMYSSYLKFYKNHFKKYIIIGYIILLKQFIGRIVKFQFKEAKMILEAIFSK